MHERIPRCPAASAASAVAVARARSGSRRVPRRPAPRPRGPARAAARQRRRPAGAARDGAAFVPPGTPGAVPGRGTGPGLLGDAHGRPQPRHAHVLDRRSRARQNGSVRVTREGGVQGDVRARRLSLRGQPRDRAAAGLGQGGQAAGPPHDGGRDRDRQAGGHVLRSSPSRCGRAASRSRPRASGPTATCSAPTRRAAPQAYLVEPDFTTTTPTPISTRGWVAWYTPAGGWHWLGVGGENASAAGTRGRRRCRASPSSIPAARRRRCRGPGARSRVPTGQGISAVGVYEIVYWVGGKPDYQWQYVNAGAPAPPRPAEGTLYCTY